MQALRQGQAALLQELAQLKGQVSKTQEQAAAPAAKRPRRLLPDIMSEAMYTSMTTAATTEPMDALFFSQG
eukprot:m.58414 g.58414  ORF g.58414 m.58414 type:complete len:71 (-) comp13761_c0_seq2:2685-2897(-)